MSKAKHQRKEKAPLARARPLSEQMVLTLKALKLTEEAALGARVFLPSEPNCLTPPGTPQRLTSMST